MNTIETSSTTVDYISQFKTYTSVHAMESDMTYMQQLGWQVAGSETIKGDFGLFKTCCLGCIFLPLALLGKKPDTYKVHYKVSKDSPYAKQLIPKQTVIIKR